MSQFQSNSGPVVPSYGNPFPITAGADARVSGLKQVTMTLTTANTVYTCTLPSAARGFRLYPTLGDIIFAVGEDPAAAGTVTGNAVAANFSVGVTVRQYDTATRIRDDQQLSETLRLRSTTANAVVLVDTF